MWKKILLAAFMIIVAFVLQSTIFQWFSFSRVCPNLIIMVVFFIGFIGGSRSGMIVGLCSGLLVDSFYSEVFGMNALILLFIGYLNGLFGKMFFDDDPKIPVILIIASDFIYNMIVYIIWFLLDGKFEFGYYLEKVIIPEVIFTFVITIILYIPITKLVKKVYIEPEKRSADNFVKKY